MKTILTIFILSGILFFTNSCKKDNRGSAKIYIAGRQIDGGKALAKYWINGVATTLSNGNTGAVANSVFVSGNDIYAAGNDGDTLKFWKNGIATKLTDGKMIAYAYSIFVYNNDVYVAGSERDSITLEYRAKYWRNGVAFDLGIGSLHSIIVVDHNIYMIGGRGYFKNGIDYSISDGANWIIRRSLTVSGNDVYVAGSSTDPNTTRSLAKYWKNGQIVPVSNVYNSEVTDISVIDNTIHLLINENGKIKYWKNGAVTTISENGVAFAFAIHGSDVYIIGNEPIPATLGKMAKYWTNGVGSDLGPGSDQIHLRSIFIKDR